MGTAGTGDGAAGGASTGGERQGRGRQPVPLSLARSGAALARCAVGVHIGATQFTIGLVDLQAVPFARRTVRIDHAVWGPRPGELVRAVAGEVTALMAQHRVPAYAVLGAGVGVAGWVDTRQGTVRRQAQLGWTDVDLARPLGAALDVPVVVGDHVHAIAAAEAWFGEGRHCETFAFLYVGAVVGCSVVVGRRVHHGAHGTAGSVGILPAWPAPAAGTGAPALARGRLLRAGPLRPGAAHRLSAAIRSAR